MYCLHTRPALDNFNPLHTIHTLALRSILILSSPIVLHGSFFPLGPPHQTHYAVLLPHTCDIPPAHLMLLDVITLLCDKKYKW